MSPTYPICLWPNNFHHTGAALGVRWVQRQEEVQNRNLVTMVHQNKSLARDTCLVHCPCGYSSVAMTRRGSLYGNMGEGKEMQLSNFKSRYCLWDAVFHIRDLTTPSCWNTEQIPSSCMPYFPSLSFHVLLRFPLEEGHFFFFFYPTVSSQKLGQQLLKWLPDQCYYQLQLFSAVQLFNCQILCPSLHSQSLQSSHKCGGTGQDLWS